MQAIPADTGVSVLNSPDSEFFGFPRTARLLTSADFQSVFKKPKKFHSRFFSIYVAPNSLSESRLGLAVSKKALPKAAARNRIKRLVRESFRKNRWQFSSLDVIFLARKELLSIENQELTEELNGVWNKLADFSVTSSRD